MIVGPDPARFTHAQASSGGAVAVLDATADIKGVFTANRALQGNGGAVFAATSRAPASTTAAGVVVRGSTLSGNQVRESPGRARDQLQRNKPFAVPCAAAV